MIQARKFVAVLLIVGYTQAQVNFCNYVADAEVKNQK